MSFWEHLEELRWHLIRSAAVLFGLAVLCFAFKNIVFDQIILAPKDPEFITNRLFCLLGKKLSIDGLCFEGLSFSLVNLNVAGQFMTHINISMMAGLILGFPYVIWELWRFVNPGLHENEKRNISKAMIAIGFLFFTGVLFGYYLILPITIAFLTSYSLSADIVNTINLKSYISTVSGICFTMGLVFELPVISFFLTKLGILTPAYMRQYRKHAVVLIIILAAVITPSGDIFTQMLVATPLWILYELSIYISKAAIRRRNVMAG